MKKTLLFSFALASALTAAAEYPQAGYYRVQTFKTERYASVIDNHGSIDYHSTTADLQAIKLQKDYDVVSSDPATILYVAPVGQDRKYQIEAQGTGLHQIIGHYVQLQESGTSPDGQPLFLAYATQSGFTKYIGDGNFYEWVDITTPTTQATGDYRKWYIRPMDENSDNFFGVRPTVDAGGRHYATMYADFPFAPASEGVKAYYISKVDKGMAVIKPIDGPVAKSTPVIFECESTQPTDNRLKIGVSADNTSGNLLKGVYFSSHIAGHVSHTPYDRNTMRVLGTMSDGSLGFVTADIDYIPQNTVYLPVAAGSPEEIKVVTEEEYAQQSGVDSIFAGETKGNVYNDQGILILRDADAEQISGLPAGLYIINGKKIIKH